MWRGGEGDGEYDGETDWGIVPIVGSRALEMARGGRWGGWRGRRRVRWRDRSGSSLLVERCMDMGDSCEDVEKDI